jgi:hypothetical protein
MNSKDNASTNADQFASSEAKAAEAAIGIDMEVEKASSDDLFDELVDYNELDEDPIPVLTKNKNGKEAVSSEDKEKKIQALRDKLAQNG